MFYKIKEFNISKEVIDPSLFFYYRSHLSGQIALDSYSEHYKKIRLAEPSAGLVKLNKYKYAEVLLTDNNRVSQMVTLSSRQLPSYRKFAMCNKGYKYNLLIDWDEFWEDIY